METWQNIAYPIVIFLSVVGNLVQTLFFGKKYRLAHSAIIAEKDAQIDNLRTFTPMKLEEYSKSVIRQFENWVSTLEEEKAQLQTIISTLEQKLASAQAEIEILHDKPSSDPVKPILAQLAASSTQASEELHALKTNAKKSLPRDLMLALLQTNWPLGPVADVLIPKKEKNESN